MCVGGLLKNASGRWLFGATMSLAGIGLAHYVRKDTEHSISRKARLLRRKEWRTNWQLDRYRMDWLSTIFVVIILASIRLTWKQLRTEKTFSVELARRLFPIARTFVAVGMRTLLKIPLCTKTASGAVGNAAVCESVRRRIISRNVLRYCNGWCSMESDSMVSTEDT